MASWLFSRPALRRHSVRRDVYMEEAKRKVSPASRTRSIAFVGLSMALLAVSAWISIPVGPVPFTLQTFVVVFAFLVLTPRECVAALTGYLALGAIGLPLFSSMRGGIGVLAGPTGGFLWGCGSRCRRPRSAAKPETQDRGRAPRSAPWPLTLRLGSSFSR